MPPLRHNRKMCHWNVASGLTSQWLHCQCLVLINTWMSSEIPCSTYLSDLKSRKFVQCKAILTEENFAVVNALASLVDQYSALSLVSVPPQPQNAPLLNDSGPHHLLLLLNTEPYAGDGPVTSVKVIYKQASSSKWRSVEGNGACVCLWCAAAGDSWNISYPRLQVTVLLLANCPV